MKSSSFESHAEVVHVSCEADCAKWHGANGSVPS